MTISGARRQRMRRAIKPLHVGRGREMKRHRVWFPVVTALGLVMVALLWGGVVSASQGAPTTVVFQGRLTDEHRQPVNDTLPMVFALYSTAEGGTPAWSETHSAVAVSDGLFRVYLGETVPLSAEVLIETPYLGLTVDSDSEMLPRQRLGSAPYARTLAPGAVISATASGPLVTVGNGLNAYESGDGTALLVHNTAGSGPALSVRLDSADGPPAAFASAIYAWREGGVGAWPALQATSNDAWPGVAANSRDGTALIGVAGDSCDGGSPAGGPFSEWYHELLPAAKAGVLGQSSIGPGGYFTATNTGLYAASIDGPAVEAYLGLTGMGSHGFNHTIDAINNSTWGFAAVFGQNGGASLQQAGPGVYGQSEGGTGVLGEAGRAPGQPMDSALRSLQASTSAGVLGYSTIGPGVYAWSTSTHSLVVSGTTSVTGDILVGGDVITNADIAELYVGVGAVEPGDVVVLDASTPLGVRRSDEAYDTQVAGIISTDPGIVLPGPVDGVPLALMGRVPVRADARYGDIEVGDLLTSSPTPGHAMRCADRLQCLGAVVGKALEPLDEGRGLILVLVSLQ
jgi:hypothetical protein